ncbi:MFS transporter [Dehalobacter sp. DCM]|uniref:MFS transporter n=1 Tax=Dehalobacter sp. DCM TaxID=2907827 RepID=UPI0030821397|nr:MFS transporter [Dehalobacter sp. DCM]
MEYTKGHIGLKSSLLVSATFGMAASALMIPLLGNVAAAFPNDNPTLLNQTIALPSLLYIPAILLSGYLAKFISKKYLLIIGSIIFAAAGFAGGFASSLMMLVVCRAIQGIGIGLAYPLAPAIISHIFSGEYRAKMLGWTQTVGCVVSVVLGLVCGYAAVASWRYAMYFYAVFAILVIMQFIFLPVFPPENKDESIAKVNKADGEKPKFGYPVYLAALAMMVFMSVAMIVLYNLAIFIMNEGLGTAAEAGMASSINTLAGFLVSLVFGYNFKFLKRYVSVLGLILMALCYLILSGAHSIAVVYVGMICLGASMNCIFPYLFTRVAQVSAKPLKTMSVSFLSMAIYLGQWISGYTSVWIAQAVGGTTRQLFSTTGFIFIGMAVIAAIFIAMTQKNESKIVVLDTDAPAA